MAGGTDTGSRAPHECPGCIDCVTCCDECRWRVVGNPECGARPMTTDRPDSGSQGGDGMDNASSVPANRAIYKYEVRPHGTPMLRGAKILHVGVQNGLPYVWAEVTLSEPTVTREITPVPTGLPPADGAYLGTVVGVEGSLVFHLYDAGDRENDDG